MCCGNVLSDQFLQDYKNCINDSKYINQIKGLYDWKQMVTGDALIANMKSNYDEVKAIIIKSDLNDVNLKNCLDKVKTLARHFDFIKYSTDELDSKLSKLSTVFKDSLFADKFGECRVILIATAEAEALLADHFNQQMVEEAHKQYKIAFEVYMNKQNKIMNKLLCKNKLDFDDIKILNEKIVKICSAKQFFMQFSYFEAKLNECYDLFINKFVEYFKNLSERVDESLKNEHEKALLSVRDVLDEMKLIRSIQNMEPVTSEYYYAALERIKGQVEEVKKDIESLLFNENNNQNCEYEKLYGLLECLQSAKWIDEYKQGTYSEFIDNFNIKITKRIINLKNSINGLVLDLENIENIKNVASIISKLSDMKHLKSFLFDLEQQIDDVIKQFYTSINKICTKIQNNFAFESQDDFS